MADGITAINIGSFTEDANNGAAVVIDPGLVVTDSTPTTTYSGSVVISNFQAGDVLAFANTNSTTFGDISALYNGSGALTLVSAGSSATLAQWQAAYRAVTFNNTSDTPSTVGRTINFFIQEGVGATLSTGGTFNVTATNDAPVNTVPATAQATFINTALVFNSANSNLISFADVDAGGATVSVTLTATNGVLTPFAAGGVTITGSGTASVNLQGTLANVTAAVNGLSFAPTTGFTGAATITVATSDLGNTGAGGPRTDSDVINIAVVSITPSVASVSSTAANGSYGVGSTIPITVTFDQAVTVTGTPQITLETGVTDRAASYVSGSGSSTLIFNYVVQAGDISADLEYQALTALALNGGVIKNSLNNNAILNLPTLGGVSSLGGQKAIVIDTVAPTVTSVTAPANGTYDTGKDLDFKVNFGEAVNVVTTSGAPRLAVTLDTGGTVFASYVSGTGTTGLVFRLPVTAAMTDMTGIVLGTSLDLNGGTIKDLAGNNATLTLTGLPVTTGILIANSPPVLGGDLTAAITEDGSYILTVADLTAVDPDDSGTGLTFSVSKLNDGRIEIGGKSVTTFTAADLAGGLVSFVHNGSEDTTASFAVKVEDGNEDNTVTTTSTFTFAVTGIVDIIDGTGKDDDLRGTRNGDIIKAMAGDDTILAFAGDDMLKGGRGDDRLKGGDGVDTFVFSGKFGIDTILDFDAKGTDHDIIDLAGVAGASDFADLKKNHLSGHGNDVVITFGKNEIVLEGVKINDLDADDFLF